MAERRFAHANNRSFDCAAGVLMLPFGRQSFLPAIVGNCDGREVLLGETTDRLVYELACCTPPVSLMYSGMGAPAVANALEMAAANGARRVVLFGACGGVAEEVGVGDLIAVTAAVRGEGTSRYYAPPEFPASFNPALVMALWLRASELESPRVHRGVVYTTDAGYRQGPEIYDAYAGLVIGVESECAAAAVVGARLGLEVAALLFCTDNVTQPKPRDQQYSGLADERVCWGFESGLEIVLEVLSAV